MSATLTSNFAPGRATSLDPYGGAIGVFGSRKLAPTGRRLRNRGGEDEAAWWRGSSSLALYHGPVVNSYRRPPG